ncbi:hypothetical protein Ddc_23183 [Ditylenchus destructor]|nr:hypothetical protein Ddc_23183 [Ditylenchus destructor]
MAGLHPRRQAVGAVRAHRGGHPQRRARADPAPRRNPAVRGGRGLERAQQQQRGETEHEDRHAGVQHPPCSRPAEHRLQQARAIAQCAEPGHAGHARTGGEGPAQIARVARGQAAQQHHRIQIDVRVEQGEGQTGQQHLPSIATVHVTRRQCTATAPRTHPGLQAIPEQEDRTTDAQHLQQQRPLQHQRAHAAHAGQDQRDIRAGAGQHHPAHMTLLQALAQHEGILCADGDDQAGAREEAGDGSGNPHRDRPGSEGTRRVRPTALFRQTDFSLSCAGKLKRHRHGPGTPATGRVCRGAGGRQLRGCGTPPVDQPISTVAADQGSGRPARAGAGGAPGAVPPHRRR